MLCTAQVSYLLQPQCAIALHDQLSSDSHTTLRPCSSNTRTEHAAGTNASPAEQHEAGKTERV
jgi:hypothetical protein